MRFNTSCYTKRRYNRNPLTCVPQNLHSDVEDNSNEQSRSGDLSTWKTHRAEVPDRDVIDHRVLSLNEVYMDPIDGYLNRPCASDPSGSARDVLSRHAETLGVPLADEDVLAAALVGIAVSVEGKIVRITGG